MMEGDGHLELDRRLILHGQFFEALDSGFKQAGNTALVSSTTYHRSSDRMTFGFCPFAFPGRGRHCLDWCKWHTGLAIRNILFSSGDTFRKRSAPNFDEIAGRGRPIAMRAFPATT